MSDTLLCVGGPLDGQRIRVPLSCEFRFEHPNPQKPDERTTYHVQNFRCGEYGTEFFVAEGVTIEQVVASLVNAYTGVANYLAPWTLPKAFSLFRQLQQRASAYGYCLALGGGVANKGSSDHDLDIVAHCHTEREEVADPLAFVLAITNGGKLLVHRAYKQKGPHVIAFFYSPEFQADVEIWFPYHWLVNGEDIAPPHMFRDVERMAAIGKNGGPCAQDLDRSSLPTDAMSDYQPGGRYYIPVNPKTGI